MSQTAGVTVFLSTKCFTINTIIITIVDTIEIANALGSNITSANILKSINIIALYHSFNFRFLVFSTILITANINKSAVINASAAKTKYTVLKGDDTNIAVGPSAPPIIAMDGFLSMFSLVRIKNIIQEINKMAKARRKIHFLLFSITVY